MADEILLDRGDGVAVVTLNRPDRMNAVHLDMMVELGDLLAQLEGDDEVGAIVLTGAGRGFCSGGDVKAMATRGPRSFEGRVADLKRMHRVPLAIRSMPKIVIAAINGPAAGAGMSMALACDLRFAADTARFSTSFAKVGLSGDFGGSQTLQRLVGPTMARELYLTSRSIDAEEALKIGLVGRLLPGERLMAEALTVAREIAGGPRVAYGLMKRNMLMAETEPFAALLDLEAFHQARSSSTADHAEAKQAIVEKRAPIFRGA